MSGTAAAAAAGAIGPADPHAAQAAVADHAPIELDDPVPVGDLSTPALLIDLDKFESNLSKMAAHALAKGIGIRPHTKTHKCPIIARKQIELGAVGVCAAKVSEAEVMIDGGVEEVLITSPVATKEKIDRVIALAKKAPGLQMMLDNAKSASDFNDAARAAGATLRVLAGLDTGTRRTGSPLGQPVLDLVEHVIQNCPSLQFDGLQAYAGHVMHVPGHEKRKERSVEALTACLETKALIEKAGHEVGVFTGGGTGTFDIDCDLEGVTDLQVGSYLFMDTQYRAIGDAHGEVFDHFEPSLFVLVTAISQPVPDRMTLDSGSKAFATDAGLPQFRKPNGLEYHFGGDEHGMCRIVDASYKVQLGDKFEMLVPHCDPTVNLYDFYYPYRNGVVEEIWPIAARGHSQ